MERPNKLSRPGFTNLELQLVIAIITMTLALLLPPINREVDHPANTAPTEVPAEKGPIEDHV
ncbi:MAG TPA: type II secretion system protein [Gemmatales bacterium]|nr:type II secretion system protein [Gemmatales bacterium]HMP16958.1 type II secretion system protein [Gemmatales bacterium]